MQRKDVEALARYLRHEKQGVAADRVMALLDRAERAEAERDALQGQLDDLRNGWANSVKAHADALAERDAAFAAGQEEMRERAAVVCDTWSSTISPETDGSTGAGLCEADIRALPIKDSPDGR